MTIIKKGYHTIAISVPSRTETQGQFLQAASTEIIRENKHLFFNSFYSYPSLCKIKEKGRSLRGVYNVHYIMYVDVALGSVPLLFETPECGKK